MSKYLEWKKRAFLMSSNIWWLPSGMSRDDVVAVYQFKGAANEATARTDITGKNYTLTNVQATKFHENPIVPTWSENSGFRLNAEAWGDTYAFSGLNNDALNAQSIQCAIIRYTDLTQLTNSYYNTTVRGCVLCSPSIRVHADANFDLFWQDDNYTRYHDAYYAGGPGYDKDNGDYINYGRTFATTDNRDFEASAVVGVNASGKSYHSDNYPWNDGNFTGPQLYRDGVPCNMWCSTEAWAGRYYYASTTHWTIGGHYSGLGGATNPVTIVCAAFYSRNLTDAEHATLASNMMKL